MPELAAIHVHPIKALDAHSLESVQMSELGGLAHDREYAIVDEDGEYVNGKRTADVHRLRTTYDDNLETVEVGVQGDDARTFHLDDTAALESWLSEYFGYTVELRRAPGGRYTDGGVFREEMLPGPTLISRATLREVASWFDGVSPDEMRRRLRPNLVVDGVEAFWEDRLVADGGVEFRIGVQELRGVEPIYRCVVPSRDPETGDVLPDFKSTFLRKREETFPAWVDEAAFKHLYATMVRLGIAEKTTEQLVVGDEVVIECQPE